MQTKWFLIKQLFKRYLRIILVKQSKNLKNIVAPAGVEIVKPEDFIHTSELFNRKKALHLNLLHYKFNSSAKGITDRSENTFILTLNNIRIFSSVGCVISSKNLIVPETKSVNNWHIALLNNFYFCKLKRLYGRCLVITAGYADNNYFHWMTDALPKIEISLKAGYPLNIFDHILVSNDYFPFQKETLAYLEIPEERIISLSTYKLVFCEELIMPSSTCLSGNVSGWIIDYLRRIFFAWMKHDAQQPKRIFIGRKNGNKRVLLNEIEVLQALKEYGYSVVYLEDLSVQQQIRMFFNAKEIIGIHGAGLTNLIFSQPNTFVMELFPPGYVNQCYWTIASKNSLCYSYLIGENLKINIDDNYLIDSDFNVSINDLLKLRSEIVA